MPIRYEWADERKIIMHIYLETPWTWQEYNAIVDDVTSILVTVGHPCATVVNTENMGMMPRDGNILQSLLRAEKSMPDNVFASAIVGTPMMVRVFMDLLMRLRPRAEKLALFVDTMEEAHDRIYARRREIYAGTGD